MIQGASRYLKEVQRLFLGSFKYVLRKFPGCLKKVPSVFHGNFIKSFKDVSRIFEVSFAILFHESHRSYPSRRRAC